MQPLPLLILIQFLLLISSTAFSESCIEEFSKIHTNHSSNICELPPEVGDCDAAIPRYYYDADSGTCEQFIYGGCGGNANNYTSFNLCISACGNTCQLEPEVGPCGAVIPRYYYNTNSGTCEQFIYGGCGGNENNYSSFNLCITACGNTCQLAPEVGPCDAAIPRYFYNTNSGTCEQFIYGGCGGNENNYTSFNLCMAACDNPCQLEPELGPCDAVIPRYYYDTNSSTCEQFIYGGCSGNANNYISFNVCMAACVNPCQLDPEVGPCDAAIPRYYYNTNSGTCEQFIYGGCGGNANNYSSFNVCITACGNTCQLEPELGPCHAVIPRYYYNTDSGTCELFNYGGCGGNENNYTSFNLCIAACGNTCQLEPEVGPCAAVIPRYYYDTNSGTCELFNYGGCGGNENNYTSFNLCITACGNTCQLKPEVGPCDAAIPRYYFNTESGMCEEFIYGGCGGNENNYLTKSSCMEACGDICYMPPRVGPCDAAIPRYFFNPNTQTCELFIYGGCNGNGNNYQSFTLCMNSCADICDQPADVGPCNAVIPRYFFNSRIQSCESFIWGGCGGNDNNFISITACQSACPCAKIVEDDQLYAFKMNETIDASDNISSTSILIDSSSVIYSAHKYVLLQEGFKVEKNASLHVILEGCID